MRNKTDKITALRELTFQWVMGGLFWFPCKAAGLDKGGSIFFWILILGLWIDTGKWLLNPVKTVIRDKSLRKSIVGVGVTKRISNVCLFPHQRWELSKTRVPMVVSKVTCLFEGWPVFLPFQSSSASPQGSAKNHIGTSILKSLLLGYNKWSN